MKRRQLQSRNASIEVAGLRTACHLDKPRVDEMDRQFKTKTTTNQPLNNVWPSRRHALKYGSAYRLRTAPPFSYSIGRKWNYYT